MLKLLNIVDEFTREALAMLVDRRIDADRTVAVLERLAAERGAPAHLRCDNGPELTAHALRDWCRFSGTGTAFIEPGSPWQNPFVESFNARVRDELLDVEQFSCLAEAQVVIADWQDDYKTLRPHSALGMRAPAAFATDWTPPEARAAGGSAPLGTPGLRGPARSLTHWPTVRLTDYLAGPTTHQLSHALDRRTGSGQCCLTTIMRS